MSCSPAVKAATVICGGGAITMTGGAANGNELWSGASDANYIGGDSSATIVGSRLPICTNTLEKRCK